MYLFIDGERKEERFKVDGAVGSSTFSGSAARDSF